MDLPVTSRKVSCSLILTYPLPKAIVPTRDAASEFNGELVLQTIKRKSLDLFHITEIAFLSFLYLKFNMNKE
ncbi:MAG: hypothetical protein QOG55_3869 [Acidobacteriaceae bacterium]|jgi:hypothetical protein|nr:hypothetical protein [Acidobacteriaceae bacterium]